MSATHGLPHPRERRRVRGLEWIVLGLLAVVELAAAGTLNGADARDSGESSVEVAGEGVADVSDGTNGEAP